jgi:hypothetical protein
MQTLGIILQLLGSVGMMCFPKKFGFATNVEDYQVAQDKWLGLNGYQFWTLSWGLVILGTILTLF